MTKKERDELARRKPPYVIGKRSGYYWQPKGKVREISPSCELGTDQMTAYVRGWELYYAAKRSLKDPSAAAAPYSISWAADKWRESHSWTHRTNGEPKSKETLRFYSTGLRVIEARIGRRDLRAFQKPHAMAWRDELMKSEHKHQGRLILATLSSFYSYCIAMGWYKGQNPAFKLGVSAPKKKGYMPWTWHRIRLFYEKAVEMGRPSVGLAVVLIYDIGQNPIDILAVQWTDTGPKDVIQLYDDGTPRYRDGEVDMSRSKTGVGGITPLSSWCVDMIEKIPEEDRHGHMIINEETGEPYTKRIFNKWVAKIRKEAGLPTDLKAGNLRHEAGQEADDGGASAEDIQSLMKHSDIGTQKYYLRRMRADAAQAARERFRAQQAENEDEKV